MDHGSIAHREGSQSPTIPDHIVWETHDVEVSYEDALSVERAIVEIKRERLEIQRQRLLVKLERMDAIKVELDTKYEKLKGRPKSIRVDQNTLNVRRFHLETQRKIAAKDQESLFIEREAVRMERDMRHVISEETRRNTQYTQFNMEATMDMPSPTEQMHVGKSITRPNTAPPERPPTTQRTIGTRTAASSSTTEKLTKMQKLRLIMRWLGRHFPDVSDDEVMQAAEQAPALTASLLRIGGTSTFPFRNEEEILAFVKAQMQSIAGDEKVAREYRKKFCESYGDLAILAYTTITVLEKR